MRIVRKIRQRLRDMRSLKETGLRAEQIAIEMGETLVGAEHWVLAALEMPDDSARRAFERINADHHLLRDALQKQYRDALESIGIDAAALAIPEGAGTPAPTEPEDFQGFKAQASTRALFAQMADDGHSNAPLSEVPAFSSAIVVHSASKLDRGSLPRALETMGVNREALRSAAAAVISELSAAA